MLIEQITKRMEHLKGTIHLSPSRKKPQFYHYNKGTKKYLKEEEAAFIRALCQKDYDQRVLQSALKELQKLEKFCSTYSQNTYESIYENLGSERRNRIVSNFLPDEEYIHQWEQIDYPRKQFSADAPEYYTNKGERVRSKTEILIANALQKHGIPYRYEAPLKLSHYGLIHPDFTVLNVRLRKELYWEHMGMMDDENYLAQALDRIIAYEKNNIFPGIGLILTHETSKCPIHSKLLDNLITTYCK